MQNNAIIRLATEKDAQATLAIYAPYVTDTAITFDYDVPSEMEFAEKIRHITTDFPWLVCEIEGEIVGYVYASKHREKTAYQWSAESTVYFSSSYHRKGLAKILYETLFSLLKLQGYVNVYAGVTLPNEKSEGFHLAQGFEVIGDFTKIGYKLGKWRDVRWYQRHLNAHSENPPLPKKMSEVQHSVEFQVIMQTANRQILNK